MTLFIELVDYLVERLEIETERVRGYTDGKVIPR